MPFGPGQMWVHSGVLSEVVGGWQLNGQFSHYSGFPFSVSANSNTIGGFTPGFGATYAQLTGHYQQEGGHNRTFGNAAVSGGRPWFNPAIFSNPTESAASPVLPNTSRDEFRGPGNSQFNTSLFKSFKVYRESEFQIRIEAFNLFNHPFLNNPNTTVPSNTNIANGAYGTFGLVTTYGPGYSQTQGTRSLQFGGRFNF
jgi:hypothetical protein